MLWFCGFVINLCKIVPVQGKKSDHPVYHIMLLLVDGAALSPVRICSFGNLNLSCHNSHHGQVLTTGGTREHLIFNTYARETVRSLTLRG